MQTSITAGPGVTGLLGVAFVVLRLTGVITWPWIWVLAPFWGPLALGIIFLVVGSIVYVILKCFSGRK